MAATITATITAPRQVVRGEYQQAGSGIKVIIQAGDRFGGGDRRGRCGPVSGFHHAIV